MSRSYFFTRSRLLSSSALSTNNHEIQRIRNIGIIAHIDAGKTTTSELMLFYSGYTSRIGKVDRGDTIMDYLTEERKRGITISSAAITFAWQERQINLIDTPGHVDFGMEVERSLRVMDGVVTILDGRMGVQAQTRAVWRQANKFNIPRIIYVNKMDKVGADFDSILADCAKERELAGRMPIAIQFPIISKGRVEAVIDLIRKERLEWTGERGQIINKSSDTLPQALLEERRASLLEKLAGLDDEMLEKFISNGPESISETEIISALRRLTLENKVVPVLCGSSFTNVGVQPLLDAIIDFLPSPADCPLSNNVIAKLKPSNLAALVFKVAFDEQRGGLLVYVRVYNGTLTTGMLLRNVNKGIKERPTRIMNVFANSLKETLSVETGNIAILIGLKNTGTGDTLLSDIDVKQGLAVQLDGISSPDPVFTCAVEADTSSEEPKLDKALCLIQLEDPSIKSGRDLETGQRYVSGMGELHLEIVEKRLRDDFKVKASFGDLQITYKEQIDAFPSPTILEESIDKDIAGRGKLVAGLKIEILKLEGSVNCIKVLPQADDPEVVASIVNGIEGALQMGPTITMPIVGLDIKIHDLIWTNGLSSVEAFNYLSNTMMKKWLASQSSRLVEPVMDVEITVPSEYLGPILNDVISGRRGVVNETDTSDIEEATIFSEIPLAEMLGYASHLRSKTAGSGSFSMRPLTYKLMSREEENRVLARFGLTKAVKE